MCAEVQDIGLLVTPATTTGLVSGVPSLLAAVTHSTPAAVVTGLGQNEKRIVARADKVGLPDDRIPALVNALW